MFAHVHFAFLYLFQEAESVGFDVPHLWSQMGGRPNPS